jgi:hypothetical protein
MLAWDDVKDEFAWDGSWRDICIPNTSMGDWQIVLDTLRNAKFTTKYTVSGEPAEIPQTAAEAFPLPGEMNHLLAVETNRVVLCCHFFDEHEVEFDLDPREVVSQAELDGLVAFMSRLACATGKPAFMTPENMHEVFFIRVDASGGVEYISSGGFFIRP